nr:ribonuclease H-like domain-containing protein [Tanacetum cinerariifolium]
MRRPENKTKEAKQVYGLMARFESDFAVPAGNAVGGVNPAAAEFSMMGISPKVQTCPFGCDSKLSDLRKNYEHLKKLYNDSFIQVQAHKNTVKTLERQKDWYHQTQLALEEKVRILSANLENTTNTLKYSKTLNAQANIEKQEWEVKFVESLDRTKLGLGFKEYIGSYEVCDLSTPSVFSLEPDNREVKSLYERFVKAGNMHEVPPLITGTFMPTSYQSDLAETQETFGSKFNTSSIPTSESNDFVSCDNSDKSSTSETYDFASCVSSPKANDSFFTVDVKILPKSDVKDPSPTNDFSGCSFKENVKSTRNLCNKSGIADRIHCKNNFVRSKKCFVCGSKSHLIKDCHVYYTVDKFSSVVLKVASVPAGSRNSSASTTADRSIPDASRNRSASIHAGRSIPAANIGIVDSGCSRSMTGNKEKLADFMQVKGGTVTFGGGDVLSKEFQLPDESQVVLRIPRRHDLYTFNLSDIQPEPDFMCLLAKASLEESTKWHRRMAHVNFKTINKLAKLRLVEGLPLKLFTNEHNCVSCNKGKQHKASYKAVSTVRTISEPLQLLHID